MYSEVEMTKHQNRVPEYWPEKKDHWSLVRREDCSSRQRLRAAALSTLAKRSPSPTPVKWSQP